MSDPTLEGRLILRALILRSTQAIEQLAGGIAQELDDKTMARLVKVAVDASRSVDDAHAEQLAEKWK